MSCIYLKFLTRRCCCLKLRGVLRRPFVVARVKIVSFRLACSIKIFCLNITHSLFVLLFDYYSSCVLLFLSCIIFVFLYLNFIQLLFISQFILFDYYFICFFVSNIIFGWLYCMCLCEAIDGSSLIKHWMNHGHLQLRLFHSI